MAYHRIRDMLRKPTPDGTEAAQLNEGPLDITYERFKANASGNRTSSKTQVIYILSGTMSLTVGAESREVKAGDVWLVPAGEAVSFKTGNVEAIGLLVTA